MILQNQEVFLKERDGKHPIMNYGKNYLFLFQHLAAIT